MCKSKNSFLKVVKNSMKNIEEIFIEAEVNNINAFQTIEQCVPPPFEWEIRCYNLGEENE